jgi:ATPase subunit of ABC transporter with duplicated ATPase domains
VHGGGFADYAEAREARLGRLDELHRRWEEEHLHLKDLVRRLRIQATMSDAMASRYSAAVTRLRKFEEAGPPAERPRRQDVRMRLRGGRTGVRVLTCHHLAIPGLVRPFDLEVSFGERIAMLGNNGTGKSHLLRLFAGEEIAHDGRFVLGARVLPGHFKQTHEHPELRGHTLVESLHQHGLDRAAAMRALDRYELVSHGEQDFATLSGGQQARFLILLLEIGGATLLLLDEPTDNLDVHSAEALERGLDEFEGTVIAVTHDRWFARCFNRFLVVSEDGVVTDQSSPVWD